ncbi:MAG: cytochrome c peroxidase [Bacteroidota bacterium]
MTVRKILVTIWMSWLGLMVSCQSVQEEATDAQEITFKQPASFPAPTYNLRENPVSSEVFALGRLLFYDGILSRDYTIACGSCHIQGTAFTHHFHDVSHGIEDRLGTRNAPSLANMAWQKEFFWDGGVNNLDMFHIVPIEDPVEMDESMENVLKRLRAHPDYPARFEAAFGTKEINYERFSKALSQFVVLMVSANARYDQYKRGEVELNVKEMAGLRLFKQKCASCHRGELFSDMTYRNNGLAINQYNDVGRYRITQLESDKYKFKVPSLRNVANTFPYMHDGRFYTLEQVLNHYQGGVQDTPNLDSLLIRGDQRGIPLTQEEKLQLIAFLKTLTDEEFLRDKRFAETGTDIIR